MFFQIDRAIDMAHKKIDYPRKPWTRTFPKMPFPSQSDLFFMLRPWFFENWAKITGLAERKIS